MDGTPKQKKSIFGGLALLLTCALANAEEPRFTTYQTHTNARFPVELDVNYTVERIRAGGADVGLRVVFNGAAGTTLGRGVAAENAAATSGGATHQDPRTATVMRKVSSGDVIYEIRFSQQARKLGVEFFNYRNKAASEVMVDYWFAKATGAVATVGTVAPTTPVSARKPAAAPAAKVPGPGGKPTAVAVAAPTRANPCPGPLKAGHDVLLRYALYHRPYDLVKRIGIKTADEGYEYSSPPAADPVMGKDAPPNDRTHYALALRLTKKKKHGLALRTIDFFEKSFKSSPYAAEMSFLKANTLLRLADEMQSEKLRGQAADMLATIANLEPRTDRGLKARLFLLKRAASEKQLARSLDLAKAGAALKDQYEPLYLLTAAEAHLALGDLDQAAHHYQVLWELGVKSDLAPEAAYRAGDIAILQGDFEKAEKLYVQALRTFPDRVNLYPSAVFNLAETYYRRGNMKDAREMFLEFKNRFPHDAVLWAAELRVPEIDREMSQNLAESAGRYLAIVDRHPYTTGAYIAEMRLADCAVASGDDRKKIFFENYFVKEAAQKHGHELINMLELKRLTDLAHIRFANAAGSFEDVLPYIDAYRDRVAELDVAASFTTEFRTAAVSAVKSMVEDERYKDAIAAESRYGDFAGNPKPIAYELALLTAYQRLGQLADVESVARRLGNRMDGAAQDEKDAFHAADYRRQRLLNADAKDLAAALQRISDNGAHSAYKYYELADLSVSSKDYRLAAEYDTKLLESGTRVKQLKPRQELQARLRLIESLLAQGDAATARKLSDRFLLSRGALMEYADLQAKARELHAESLYKTGYFREALAVIDDVLKFSQEESQKFIRRTEFEFLRAKCLDGLSRGKEALDSYRKIAASDKGLWGKSAQAEIDHKDFKQQNQGMEKR